MAHPCIHCGSECYCSGDLDDIICSKTPKRCEGCGCEEFAEDQGWDEDDFDDNEYFNPCSQCNQPDVCEDFGCSKELLIKKYNNDTDKGK